MKYEVWYGVYGLWALIQNYGMGIYGADFRYGLWDGYGGNQLWAHTGLILTPSLSV